MKNTKKRFISLLSAVTFLLTVTCFTACTNESTNLDTTSVTEKETTSAATITSETSESTTSENIDTTVSQTELSASLEHHIDFETVKYDEYNNKGCELPATCALLNFYGIEITPSKLFEYVPTASQNTPAKDILWYTWDSTGMSCYSPVIEIALQGVFVDNSIKDKSIIRLSEMNFDELLSTYIDSDIPVLIWSTVFMYEPTFETAYASDGSFEYTNYAHCYIITGYTENIIQAYEPHSGEIEEYPRDIFIQRYEDLFSQAIVIEENN